jgi:hypothetical protein
MLVPTKCEGEYGACLSSTVRVEDLAYNAKTIEPFSTSYAAVIDTDADPNMKVWNGYVHFATSIVQTDEKQKYGGKLTLLYKSSR